MSRPVFIDPSGRICLKCKAFKSWDLFDKKKNGLNGHHSQCKFCIGNFKKKWWIKKSKRKYLVSKTLEFKKSDLFEQTVDWNSHEKLEFEKIMRSMVIDIYSSRKVKN